MPRSTHSVQGNRGTTPRDDSEAHDDPGGRSTPLQDHDDHPSDEGRQQQAQIHRALDLTIDPLRRTGTCRIRGAHTLPCRFRGGHTLTLGVSCASNVSPIPLPSPNSVSYTHLTLPTSDLV